MGQALSQQEIKERLVRLTNLERLYAEARKRIEQQDVLISEQAQMIKKLQDINEQLMIRVEQLERMIFGSKRDKKGNNESDAVGGSTQSNREVSKRKRSPDSYHRSCPRVEEITHKEYCAVLQCKHCQGQLTELEEHVRYEEDIDLEMLKKAKKVIKYVVERGYCVRCGKYSSGKDLRGQEVVLGNGIRTLICFLSTILDHTFEQIRIITSTCFGITVSDGEIAGSIHNYGLMWRPEYERLKEMIRGQPGQHIDETVHAIQEHGGKHGYAWVMSGSETQDRVYQLADSRGKGNAQVLLGDNPDGVRITDCYGAYKRLPGKHQVCWAHFKRKARELSELACLGEEKRTRAQAWHDEFSHLYATLQAYLLEPFEQKKRKKQIKALLDKVRHLCIKDGRDPKKLADLKALMLEYEHALFTCMEVEGIPCDNNRAERDLRKLVIKRKKSFGCKTEKGAKALEVILSVCWSTWYRCKEQFFPTLRALG
jgi:transposase